MSISSGLLVVAKIVIDQFDLRRVGHQPGCYGRQYHGILTPKLIDKEREL